MAVGLLLCLATAAAAKRPAAPPRRPAAGGFAKPASGAPSPIETEQTTALFGYLKSSGAKLDAVGLADFDGLRGVVATRKIKKGDDIVSIPASCAIDLGINSDDPVPAALNMLRTRAAEYGGSPRDAYWDLLPPPDSPDLCTPDFFSEKELLMLRWPPLVVEVRRRSAAIREALGCAAPSGETSVDELSAAGGALRELRWAVWAVQSRVLTVLGPDRAGHKLLIPFIDMFNHKPTSRHYLTGRTDGALRVVAGETVAPGEQIFIVYGTPETTNAEFLGHYGFLDAAAAGADAALLRAYPEAAAALLATADDDMPQPATPNEAMALRFRGALLRAARRAGAS